MYCFAKNGLLLFLLFISIEAFAVVKYDEGRIMIDGIQLLQDRDNSNDYYYLPQYPRLAQRPDGTFEFFCIKYVGRDGPETNGGLFHALIEFTLLPEQINELQAKLQEEVPGGRIVGPVPMQQNMQDGESGMASFEVVSSILTDQEGDNAFTQSFVTSGHAPLLPGSRSAIAAKLSQDGATLLWESLEGATSDVSIAINGYYEAAVKGYNAVITADASTVYKHLSNIMGSQEGYSRSQLFDITDKLIQDQMISVDVFDRSEGLGIDTDDMASITNLVTTKLIDLMFDAKAGWAVAPTKVPALEQQKFPGRQKKGGFIQFFSHSGNQKYITDHQFILKDVKNVRTNKFYLNLSKSTTIKVPFYTSGNIRGFYGNYKDDDKYFRIVDLSPGSFEKRQVLFQVDGAFTEAFGDILNFVSVSLKKEYNGEYNDVTKEIIIKGQDLIEGKDVKTVEYSALELEGDDLLNYQYRISWSFKGESRTVKIPPNEDQWLKSKEMAVSLKPPFGKRLIEIDADRAEFEPTGMKSATIRFFATLNGKPQVQKTLVLRAGDTENTSKVALYFDKDQPLAYQVNWYPTKSQNPIKGPIEELKDDYLYLVPPQQ